MKFPFLGGAYSGRSSNMDAQTCINLMVEGDPSTPEGNALVGTPGYTEVDTTPPFAEQVRGMLSFTVAGAPLMAIVVGNRLYAYAPVGDVWQRLDNADGSPWTMNTHTGPVSMAFMGLGPAGWSVAVADGANLNVYESVGPTSTTITVSSVVSARTVVFMDGRFIADDSDFPGRFIYSDILDPTSFNALNFATAEGSPDTLQAIFADRREVYLFGERSTEVWYDQGDANNPFARYQGGFIETGCAASYSVARLDNAIAWLAVDARGLCYVALLGPNYQPQTISTPQINYLLQNYATVSDAFAVSYRLGGHECYVLTFPTEDVTWVYDSTTREWHQWRSGEGGKHLMQAMCPVVSAYGQDLYLSTTATDGKLYIVSATDYTDNGTAIGRERISHHVMADQKRVPIAEMQFDMEEGTSTTLSRNTTLSVAAVAGDTSVTTTASSSVALFDTLALTLDNGQIWLCSVAASASTTLTLLVDHVPSAAAAGNAATVYADDTCQLAISKDGGQSWSTEKSIHMGVAVTKALRVMLRQLGVARQWTVRFRTSAAVKIAIRGVLARLWGEAA